MRKMERKAYRCSGCGKVIISGTRPPGWKQEWGGGHEGYLCDQCRDELKPRELLVLA